MDINILKLATIINDDDPVGSVVLTQPQLESLVDNDVSTFVTLGNSESISLGVDLLSRYNLKEIKYYITPVTTDGVVISSSFNGTDYYSHSLLATQSYVSVILDGAQTSPRYIKLYHTASGTVNISGLSVLSDDTVVDFGISGATVAVTLDDAPIGTQSQSITAIPIYNDSVNDATAYVFIGGNDTEADAMVDIATSPSGPFVKQGAPLAVIDDTGLVFEALMGEGTGGSVYDNVGGVTGAAVDVTWSTDVPSSLFSYSLSFNGASSYVSFGNPASLQITSDITIMGWVKSAAVVSSRQSLISKFTDSSNNRGYNLSILDSGGSRFLVAPNSTGNYQLQAIPPRVDTGDWVFISGVYDTTTNDLSLYLDGELIGGVHAGDTDLSSSIYNAAVNFVLGSDSGLSNYFNGSIGCVRVFNRALRAHEIKNWYNNDLGNSTIKSFTFPYSEDLIDLAPVSSVLQLLFSDGVGSYVSDSSGNSNNGLIYNATWSSDAHGPASSYSLSFDGASAYVDFGNPPELQITNSVTLAAWVNLGAGWAGVGHVLCKDDATNNLRSYDLLINASRQLVMSVSSTGAMTANNGITKTGGTALSTGDWYFICGVYDSVARSLRIFINGDEETGAVHTTTYSPLGGVPAALYNTTADFCLGAAHNTSTDGHYEYFNGGIDTAWVFNTALSSDQVRGLMGNSLSNGLLLTNTVLDSTTIHGSVTVSDSSNSGVYISPVIDTQMTPVTVDWEVQYDGDSLISNTYPAALSSIMVRSGDTAPKHSNISTNKVWGTSTYLSTRRKGALINTYTQTTDAGSAIDANSVLGVGVDHQQQAVYIVYKKTGATTFGVRKNSLFMEQITANVNEVSSGGVSNPVRSSAAMNGKVYVIGSGGVHEIDFYNSTSSLLITSTNLNSYRPGGLGTYWGIAANGRYLYVYLGQLRITYISRADPTVAIAGLTHTAPFVSGGVLTDLSSSSASAGVTYNPSTNRFMAGVNMYNVVTTEEYNHRNRLVSYRIGGRAYSRRDVNKEVEFDVTSSRMFTHNNISTTSTYRTHDISYSSELGVYYTAERNSGTTPRVSVLSAGFVKPWVSGQLAAPDDVYWGDENLVLDLPMTEGSGTTIYDTTFNYNTGTVFGTASWEETNRDDFSYSLNFDGATGYIKVNDSVSLDLIADFTLTAWVKLDSEQIGNNVIMSKGVDSSTFSFKLSIYTGTSRQGGEVVCEWSTNGTTHIKRSWTQGTYINTGEWAFVSVAYSSLSRDMTISVNGNPVGSNVTDPNNYSTGLYQGATDLYIGCRYDGAASTDFFNGSIGPVKIFNKALTYDEINNVMNDSGWDSRLEWVPISRNSMIIPNNRYIQVKMVLNPDGVGNVPTLTKLKVIPGVKVDVPAGSSTNVYVRTNISDDTDVSHQETKLNVIWGVTS